MIEQHSHNFGEWVITKSPTCTDPGERMRSCDCNEIETEVIRPTGHDYEDGICKNCGSKQSTDVPNTPDKPDDSVKTADGSHVELWIALLCLSLTASGIVLYGRKREE